MKKQMDYTETVVPVAEDELAPEGHIKGNRYFIEDEKADPNAIESQMKVIVGLRNKINQ